MKKTEPYIPIDVKYNLMLASFAGWSQIERKIGGILLPHQYVGYPPKNAIIGQKQPIPHFMDDLNLLADVERNLDLEDVPLYFNILKNWFYAPVNDKGIPQEIAAIFAPATARAQGLINIISDKVVDKSKPGV